MRGVTAVRLGAVATRCVAVFALMLGASLGIASPASAATGGLEFSADGSTWSTTAPASLFFEAIQLVPGDSLSSTVWVRSTRSSAVRLTAVLGEVTTSTSEAAPVFHLSGGDGSGAGLSATPADEVDDCTELVPSRLLSGGTAVPITTTVSIPAGVSGRAGQDSDISFVLQIALTDPELSQTPDGCPVGATEIPSEPGDAVLPITGANLVPQTLAVAVTALTLGGLLVGLARRRREAERLEAGRVRVRGGHPGPPARG